MRVNKEPPISLRRAGREFLGILLAYAAFYVAIVILLHLHAI